MEQSKTIINKCFGFIKCVLVGFAIVMFLSIVNTSCKKAVSVGPPINRTTTASVYELDASAAAVLTGIYTNWSRGSFATGASSISLFCGLSADEFKLADDISNTDIFYYYYTNALFSNPVGNPGTENWPSCYMYIYTCNEAVERLSRSTSLTSPVKQQLLGEAKFLRAFLYFYLVNLYGDIPLAVTSDYEINSKLARASQMEVYQQVIADLLEAKELLSDRYLAGDALTSTNGRLRPTKWAAAALLSRVYLFIGDYSKAELQATDVISNPLFELDNSLNSVFLANSSEAIWQLQPVNSGWNTEDARLFVINSAPSGSKPVSLSQALLNAFNQNDMRKKYWVKDTTIDGKLLSYPYKYKRAEQDDPVTEYLMVLRLAEQYLIRAEAKVQLGIGTAVDDLNVIRNRSGLLNYSGSLDKSSLLAAIFHERQVEYFSEWGHRWLDLKRTGAVDAIMTKVCAQKGGVWQSHKQLYPILYTEIERGQNITQNTGY